MSFSISPWNLINSMKSVEDWQNTISGNLNGATQIGYKQFDVYFGGGATTTLRTPSLSGAAKQIAETYMQTNYTMIDFSNGALIDSNNWTDVAIDGEGFFMATSKLSNPAPEDIYFTRNGEWHIDSDGYLRTKEGLYILDGTQIPGDPNPSLNWVPPWAGSVFNNWNDRERLLVKNTSGSSLTQDTVIELSLDTSDLIAQGLLDIGSNPNLEDLRIGYYDGANWTDVPREIVPGTENTGDTKVRFRLKDNLAAGQTIADKYYVFYDYSPMGAGGGPAPAPPVSTQPIGVLDSDGAVDNYSGTFSPQIDPAGVNSVEDWLNASGPDSWIAGPLPSPSLSWSGVPAGNITYTDDGATGYTFNGQPSTTATAISVYKELDASKPGGWKFIDSLGNEITMKVIKGTNFNTTTEVSPDYDFTLSKADLLVDGSNLDPALTKWNPFTPTDIGAPGLAGVEITAGSTTNYQSIPAPAGWGPNPTTGLTSPFIAAGGVVAGDSNFDANDSVWAGEIGAGNDISDDFSTGNQWTSEFGSFAVSGGKYQNTFVAADSRNDSLSYLNTGGPQADFTLTTQFNMLSAGSSPKDYIGFQFRKAGQSDDIDDSGYTVRILRNGSLEMYKAGSGVVATSAGAAFNATDKNLKIEAVGNNIKVYIDSVLKIDYTDAASSYMTGYVGFRASNQDAVVTTIDIQDDFSANPFLPAGPLTNVSGNLAWNSVNQNVENTGVVGNSLELDAVNKEFATAADSASLDIGGSTLTMEGWINWNGGSMAQQIIVNKEDSYELGLLNGGLWMAVETTNAAPWFATNYNDPAVAITPNTWHHVAGTYDGSNMKLYIDGALVQTTATSGTIVSTADALDIGARGGTTNPNSFFDGQIDEVRISDNVRYPAAFTPSTQEFLPDANTRALYHFDEANGTTSGGTAADSSGNGNTLTLTSGTNTTAIANENFDSTFAGSITNMISQNFDAVGVGTLPGSWTQQILTGDVAGSVNWQVTDSTDGNVASSGPNSLYIGDIGTSPDSDANAGRIHRAVTSPVMDMTGAASMKVAFDQSWDTRTNPNDLKYLEYTTDGVTWTNVAQYGGGTPTQAFPNTTNVNITAPAGGFTATTQVRWRFDSTSATPPATTTSTTTFLDEHFDSVGVGSIPAGWTSSGPSSGGDQWQVNNDTSTSGTNSLYYGTGSSYNDFSSGSVETPAYDLSTASNTTISFNYYSNAETGYDNAWLDYSTDNGSNWTTLNAASFIPDSYGGVQTTPWQNVSYAIPGALGVNTKFRWRFDSDVSIVGTGFNIDDVNITSTTTTAAPTDRGWNIDNVSISMETAGSLPAGWTQQITSGTAKWQVTDATDGNVANSAPNSLWFGVKGDTSDDYNGGIVAGSAISPTYNLAGAASATITFNQSWVTESGANDKKYLEYSTNGGGSWTTIAQYGAGSGTSSFPTATTETVVGGLTANTKFRFRFDSVTAANNTTRGWNIDDFAVTSVSPPIGSPTIVNSNQSPLVTNVINTSSIAYYDGGTYQNFDLKTTIDLKQSSGDVSDWAGIQFRKTNPADDYTASGYMVYMRESGAIDLYKAGVGVIASGTLPPDNPFVPGTPVPIEIKALDGHIQVFGNNAPIIDYTDATPILTNGYIGYRTLDSAWKYDDLEIGPLPPNITNPGTTQWMVDNFNLDAASIVSNDYQYLLLRQPIEVAAEGVIRNNIPINLTGFVDQDVDVYIRKASGALVPIYKDSINGYNNWSGNFDPYDVFEPGTNYIEVYASHEVASPPNVPPYAQDFNAYAINDNLATDPLGEGWQVGGGNWVVKDSAAAGSPTISASVAAAGFGKILFQNANFGGFGGPGAFILRGNAGWDDYTFQATMGTPSSDDDLLRLWVRVAAQDANGPKSGYFLFSDGGGHGQTNGAAGRFGGGTNRIGLARMDNGVVTVLASNLGSYPSGSSTVNINNFSSWYATNKDVGGVTDWWNFKIQVEGSNIKVYATTKNPAPTDQPTLLLADITDSTYAAGKFGIENLSYASWFDNMSFQPSPDRKTGFRVDTGIATGVTAIQSIDAFETVARYYVDVNGKVVDRFGDAKKASSLNQYMTSNANGIWGDGDDQNLIDYDPNTELIVDDIADVPTLEARLVQTNPNPGGEARIYMDSSGINKGPVDAEGPNNNGIQYQSSNTWNEYSLNVDFGNNSNSLIGNNDIYLRYQNATNWVRVRYNNAAGTKGLYLEKSVGGVITQLGYDSLFNIADPMNMGANLNIQVEGRNYRVYDNIGNLIFNTIDNTNPLLYGSIALGGTMGTWYDNISVNALSLLNIHSLGDGALVPDGPQDILDQMALVVFRDKQGQQGLRYSRDRGSVYFQQTTESGAPMPMIPGTGGAGIIYTNKLETSNVDMAKQVTHLASTKDVYDTLSKQLVVYLDNISSVLSLFR